MMLSLQGNLPAWGALTQAGFPDMKILDRIPVLRGAYYVMDRGYLDLTAFIDYTRRAASS